MNTPTDDPSPADLDPPPDLASPAPLAADDPRLTAYALGQLDAADLAPARAAVEAAIAADPALAAEVDAVRAVSTDLAAALAGETAATGGLDDARRARVARAAARAPRTRRFVVPAWWPVGPARTAYLTRSALAALATVLVVVLPLTYWAGRAFLSPGSPRAMSSGADVGLGSMAVGDPGITQLDARDPADSRAAVPPMAAIAPDAGDAERSAAGPVPGSLPPLARGNTNDTALDSASVPDAAYNSIQVDDFDLPPDLHATAVAPLHRPTPDPYRAPPPGGEGYRGVVDNPFLRVADAPLSTFGVDVDSASYANIRRFVTQGQLPPADAVRIEEMVNYFSYAYAPPSPRDELPFAIDVAAHPAPWAPEHRLVRIALKGREVDADRRPAANLVFLVDVSGSMDDPHKLPLVQHGLTELAKQLRSDDRVAIVTYAGEAGIALESTPGSRRGAIVDGIRRLSAGGSTNGAAGILTAYEIARRYHIEGGINRVILATDGDFNVGVTGDDALVRLISAEAAGGTFLTVLGFGMGNLQDGKLEQLADRGNGHYAYIDGAAEARRVLVTELEGTLVTIAKDVKVQVEFNPAQVAGYRLIGYENRALAPEDFADDRVDGGEIGAGHSVTALYEVVPAGAAVPGADGVPLRYQDGGDAAGRDRRGDGGVGDEMLLVKLRWKEPDGHASTERDVPFVDRGAGARAADADWRFAASVAAFGMLLRGSPYAGAADWRMVLDLAEGGLGRDDGGWRHEFLDLVQRARTLAGGDR